MRFATPSYAQGAEGTYAAKTCSVWAYGASVLRLSSEPLPMKIWVDADACPGVIKEILFRAARRTGLELTLVANHPLKTPPAANIRAIRVASGFDMADSEIVRRLALGDLVITADIPLASAVIEAGGHALSPRGERFTADTIKAQLTMRDFMETMRASGIDTGGPPALSQADRQRFANELDRFLARHKS